VVNWRSEFDQLHFSSDKKCVVDVKYCERCTPKTPHPTTI
jgi:hypothetical protein